MPSFAEQQLAKYGWKKGEGLGKDKSGISRAITVSRRTDNRGVGSDSTQWTSNWWDNLYNKAASSTAADAATDESKQYQAKIEQASKERDTLGDYNGMFVKPSASSESKSKSGCSTPASVVVDRTKLVRDGNVHLGVVISDAELFAACEGRMARKGARAEQSGKLKRVDGDGMPRPEVAARIEAALNGTLYEQAEREKKKRKKSEKEERKKEKEKKKAKSDSKKEKSKRKEGKKKEKTAK